MMIADYENIDLYTQYSIDYSAHYENIDPYTQNPIDYSAFDS